MITITRIAAQENEDCCAELWTVVVENERAGRRISHFLHDEVAQSLTAAMTWLASVNPDNFAVAQRQVGKLLLDTIGAIRDVSDEIRPVVLDHFGLSHGIGWLVQKFSERTGCPAECIAPVRTRWQSDREIQMFRITEDVLSVVEQAGRGSRVLVSVAVAEELLHVVIQVEGLSGNPPDHMPRIRAARVRARRIGGQLDVRSLDTGARQFDLWCPAEADLYAT